MKLFKIEQDIEGCIGCYSCEIHCKANKMLGEGPRLCRIYQEAPCVSEDAIAMAFVFVTCFHCKDAWCVNICPTGAMRQRADDGVVFIQEDLCVGCKLCVYSCPWGIPQYDPEKQKAVKCDMCKDRLDKGLEPACVSKCVTGCLTLEKFDEHTVFHHE